MSNIHTLILSVALGAMLSCSPVARAAPQAGNPDGLTDAEQSVIDAFDTACTQAAQSNSGALSDLCGSIDSSLANASPDQRRQILGQLADQLDPKAAALASLSLMSISHARFNTLQNRLRSLRLARQNQGQDFNQGLHLDLVGQRPSGNPLAPAPAPSMAVAGSRLLSEKWGVFFSGSASTGSQDADSSGVPDFDYHFYALSAGLDYRVNRRVTVGAAMGYTRFDADLSGTAGKADSDGWSMQGFATLDLAPGLYLDLTTGYSRSGFRQARNVDIPPFPTQHMHGSTHLNLVDASAALNYRIALDRGVSLTPYGSLYYAHAKVDAYREHGSLLSLDYAGYSFHSLLGSLGLRGTWVFNTSSGVLTPYADLALHHDAGNDATRADTRFMTTATAGPGVYVGTPDHDYGTLALGASWVFASGNQLFLQAGTPLGKQGASQYTLYLGGRIEF